MTYILWYQKGDLFARLNRFEEALEALKKAIEIDQLTYQNTKNICTKKRLFWLTLGEILYYIST
jgi:hypothetical protein